MNYADFVFVVIFYIMYTYINSKYVPFFSLSFIKTRWKFSSIYLQLNNGNNNETPLLKYIYTLLYRNCEQWLRHQIQNRQKQKFTLYSIAAITWNILNEIPQ